MTSKGSLKLTFLCVVVLGCLLQTGCVRRRLLVRSNPPGALVYVDNQPIGTTPCATDFVYYGTREIRLVKAGYETLTVNQPLPAPWYQLPGLDFISENLVPAKIHDYRTAAFNMVPQVIVPTEQLIARRRATPSKYAARRRRTCDDHRPTDSRPARQRITRSTDLRRAFARSNGSQSSIAWSSRTWSAGTRSPHLGTAKL